jgi:hypothetical protein
MGRKFQSHERYEENFVSVVEFNFDELHLSSSSIGGGRIPCSSGKEVASSDLAVPTIYLESMSSMAVNAPTGKESKHLQVLI